MLTSIIRAILLREVRAVRREIAAYPNDEDLWALPDGISNSGGTLALHLAGNLQHFIGACLGHTGYVRDRPAEFARRNVPRAEILAELDAAAVAIDRSFGKLSDGDLGAPYGEPIA